MSPDGAPEGDPPQVEPVGRRHDLLPSLRMVLARAFADSTTADRDDLVSTALAVWAPPELVVAIQDLPPRTFTDPEEVAGLLVVPRGPR